MPTIAVRDAVRQRDNFRYVYCDSAEDEIGSKLTLDHYRPRSQDGVDDAENLVACCHACNEFKGDYWSNDPERLPLHAMRDDRATHLVETIDHVLLGLTDRGRSHIVLLHLNRMELVAARRRRYRANVVKSEHELVTSRLDSVESDVMRLSALIRRLTGGISISSDDSWPLAYQFTRKEAEDRPCSFKEST